MGYRFRKGQQVDTVDGKDGTITSRSDDFGKQPRYVVNGKLYFEEELKTQTAEEKPAKKSRWGRNK